MQQKIRITQNVQGLLRCPACHSSLKREGERFNCTDPGCTSRYPIVDGIPVLINERSSVFSIDDFISRRVTFFANESKLKKTIRRLLPTISMNIRGESNYRRFTEVLLERSASPRVLVIGGSILGQGMECLAQNPAVDLVESDVSFGPRTMLICDANDLPFEDRSFDGVVMQAVLEHVTDPYRCCEEIHRVLKEQGAVYAETPFMQQVHGGRYDFTRFTHLGHRRLFRRFEEIDSGAVGGPGMALAWSYKYFLMSFSSSRRARSVLGLLAIMTSFHLKYFDTFLINMPGTLDAAAGYFFIGRKSEMVLSDRDLIKLYKGAG